MLDHYVVHPHTGLPVHDRILRRRKRDILFLFSALFLDRVSSDPPKKKKAAASGR